MANALEFKEQFVEATHHAAEGVSVGAFATFAGGVAVAYGDFLYNLGEAAITNDDKLLDVVGVYGITAMGLGFATAMAAASVLRVTDRLRDPAER